jgi:hypothetical protein
VKRLKRNKMDIKTVGYITGRNGTYNITDLDIWFTEAGKSLWIDGIGKRGCAINGGLCVDKEVFIEEATRALMELGYTVIKDKKS